MTRCWRIAGHSSVWGRCCCGRRFALRSGSCWRGGCARQQRACRSAAAARGRRRRARRSAARHNRQARVVRHAAYGVRDAIRDARHRCGAALGEGAVRGAQSRLPMPADRDPIPDGHRRAAAEADRSDGRAGDPARHERPQSRHRHLRPSRLARDRRDERDERCARRRRRRLGQRCRARSGARPLAAQISGDTRIRRALGRGARALRRQDPGSLCQGSALAGRGTAQQRHRRQLAWHERRARSWGLRTCGFWTGRTRLRRTC